MSVATVDIVGRTDGHLLHPGCSILIHEDQCALPFQRPHELATVRVGVEVAPGHVVFASDRSGLENGGGVEQSGFAFDLARAAVSFVDQLIGIVDGVCEDRGEFTESSSGLGRLALEDAGLEVENQSAQMVSHRRANILR